MHYQSQPFFGDFNGDMYMDMIYNAPNGTLLVSTLINNELKTAYFVGNVSLTAEQDSKCETPSSTDLLSNPHSSAFLDFDGDCMADIILTREINGVNDTKSYYYEIYI